MLRSRSCAVKFKVILVACENGFNFEVLLRWRGCWVLEVVADVRQVACSGVSNSLVQIGVGTWRSVGLVHLSHLSYLFHSIR